MLTNDAIVTDSTSNFAWNFCTCKINCVQLVNVWLNPDQNLINKPPDPWELSNQLWLILPASSMKALRVFRSSLKAAVCGEKNLLRCQMRFINFCPKIVSLGLGRKIPHPACDSNESLTWWISYRLAPMWGGRWAGCMGSRRRTWRHTSRCSNASHTSAWCGPEREGDFYSI